MTPVLLLLILTWVSVSLNVSLRARAKSLLETRVYPPLLQGAKLDLPSLAALQAEWRPRAALTAQRHLILALSESCAACKRDLGRWQSLLRNVAWQHDEDVWLVTFNGIRGFEFESCLDILRARKVPYGCMPSGNLPSLLP